MELISYSYIDILIGAVLAMIMFGIGLNLTPQSYRDLALHPKDLGIGLLLQMVALPLLVFGIMLLSNLPLGVKMGFIILSACPGATTSGFIIYLFRGNIALSISLTVISSLLALWSIPFIVNLASGILHTDATEIHLPWLKSILQIFIVTVIPAAAGAIFRSMRESLVLKIQKPMKYILIVLLGLVFAIKFFAGEEQGGSGISFEEVRTIMPWALLVNIAAYAMGFLMSRLMRIGVMNAFTIGINITMQNTTLAFMVAGTLLQDQNMVKPGLVYAIFSFWTAIAISLLFRWKHKA